MPSVMMASLVNLHSLYSGRFASSFEFGRSSRMTCCATTRAAFLLLPVGRADLDKLRLRRAGLCNVRFQLGLVASGVGALVALLAQIVPEEKLLWPVRLGQSAQLPADGTSCASRLLTERP